MHAVADAAIARAPNAAFLALKARACIEEWLYESGMNEAPGAAAAFKAKSVTSAFRQSLADLDDRFRDLLKTGPALSAAEAHFACNQFAVLFVAFVDRPRLKHHLTGLAAPAAVPWGYFARGNVPGFLAKLHKQLGLPRR